VIGAIYSNFLAECAAQPSFDSAYSARNSDVIFAGMKMKPYEQASAVNQRIGAGERELLTVEDVAKLLRVPTSWVYERTRRRKIDRLPGIRLGKYWRFVEADIFEWLDRQRTGTRPNA
jgi:excisionase family DNA binding protein